MLVGVSVTVAARISWLLQDVSPMIMRSYAIVMSASAVALMRVRLGTGSAVRRSSPLSSSV